MHGVSLIEETQACVVSERLANDEGSEYEGGKSIDELIKVVYEQPLMKLAEIFLMLEFAVMPLWTCYRTEFVNGSMPCRGCQVYLAKRLPDVVEFIGVFNAEIRRPTSLVFHKRDLYLCYVSAFKDALGFRSLDHGCRLCVNV